MQTLQCIGATRSAGKCDVGMCVLVRICVRPLLPKRGSMPADSRACTSYMCQPHRRQSTHLVAVHVLHVMPKASECVDERDLESRAQIALLSPEQPMRRLLQHNVQVAGVAVCMWVAFAIQRDGLTSLHARLNV